MKDAIHVFAGPSLPPSQQRELSGLVFHGPVMQGDVYALVAERPLAIAIVDGYFEHVPAIWHKELLFALSEGVHVFGAASMGALRAAELADFGMVGVGSVFDDFVTGRLTDDDEVAIVHAGAEVDYQNGSEAMVNMRATLNLARERGLLSTGVTADLTERMKALFYPDRNYAVLLSEAEGLLTGGDWRALANLVRNGNLRVDVKRQDALELVHQLQRLRATSAEPKQVAWRFQHTDAWELVRRAALTRAAERDSGLAAGSEASDRASLRALRIELARRDGFFPSKNDLAQALQRLGQTLGWSNAEDIRSWMVSRKVDDAALARLVEAEAAVEFARRVFQSAAAAELPWLALVEPAADPPASTLRAVGTPNGSHGPRG